MGLSKVNKFLTVSGLLLLTSVSASQALAAEQCSAVFATNSQALPADVNPVLLMSLFKQQVQAQLGQYAYQIVKGNPAEVLKSKSISPLIVRDLAELGTLKQETALLMEMAKLSTAGKLRPALVTLMEQLKTLPELGGKPNPLIGLAPEKQAYLLETAVSSIEGVLSLRGLTNSNVKYVEWPVLSKTMTERLDKAPVGLDHILHFSKSEFHKTSEVKILVDGEQSFAMRDSLMSKAKKSIDIMTWAVYSDKTGFEAADLLIRKHQSGVKVRLIVDGQVAGKPGYTEAVQKMEQAGIEVIRWTSASHSFKGQHRKMLIIDGEHVIAGGLNFGDVYSHKNPDVNVPRWRDTDVYIRGESTNVSRQLFADVWNRQVKEKNLSFKPIQIREKKQVAPETGDLVAVLNHDPAMDQSGSTIMMTLLKGIREAKSTVDIENAYVVTFPALKNEIQAAVARGVRVRVLTNSHTSVDEPIVSLPILRSAHELASIGAQVYLRKGSTLHSKLAVIDGEYSMVMSYNLHPRSEKVEGEMAMVVKGKRFADSVTEAFMADISPDRATHIPSPDFIQLPSDPSVIPVLRIFFDML
ncbi:phospholipase D-like domain-containing protein [Bdellovibrio sp. HCB290]|uniref:phospholipase D-like domain-containing protein n=1 Tax=Bdellovibrio sp. HCB290 TaxID=3394356 RepID=UPI0039B6161E